jgi:hypothetical protein
MQVNSQTKHHPQMAEVATDDITMKRDGVLVASTVSSSIDQIKNSQCK